MANIKLILEYDGTDYAGWQRQNSRTKNLELRTKKKTIQETIENALKKILKEEIRLIGSGRTDAGVHARGQVANFHTRRKLSPQVIKRALNSELPEDIVVKKAREVDEEFHSRFCARAKTYQYRILNRREPSVFERRFNHFVPYPLDLRLMKKEARVLLGRHNFRAFQSADRINRDAVRTLKKLAVRKKDDLITITLEADGFLRGMVRNIAGTLLEAGRGKLAAGDIARLLKSGNRKLAGPKAPGRGLFLIEVKY